MSQAARITDLTSHPGVLLGPGATTVLVAGMPAAQIGELQVSLVPPPAETVPALPLVTGSATVLVGGKPAARVGDMCGEGAVVTTGASSVVIG